MFLAPNLETPLHAYDAATSSVLRAYGAPGQFWGGGIGTANGVLYARQDTGALHAYRISSAEELWHASFDALFGPPTGRFTVDSGSIYLTTDGGALWSVSAAASKPGHIPPTYSGRVRRSRTAVYFSAGQSVQAVDARTGQATWSYASPDSVEFGTTPAVGRGLVFIGASDDSLYAIRT